MKDKIAALLGDKYIHLVRARNSKPVRILQALSTYPKAAREQKKNFPFLAFNIEAEMGYGATLIHLLRLANYADIGGQIPRIIATNPLYSEQKNEDCISPYLQIRQSQQAERMLSYTRVAHEYHYKVFGVPMFMSLARAHEVMNKYYSFTPLVTDIANAVLEREKLSSFDVSVHYRGTDKHYEAMPPTFDDVLQELSLLSQSGHSTKTIFLATDNPEFEQYFRRNLVGRQIVSYQLGEVQKGMPRHFSSLGKREKAIEAVVNMILIANSTNCIRTSSYMSAVSKIINPSLQTTTLNRTYGPLLFPERQIADSEIG